jgi:DNA-binding response OmpR family regulator
VLPFSIMMNPNSEPNARAKVLVVDDEPAILITLQRILQQAGYEVQTAQSGREGLDAFRQGHWDLVTVDRSMPEMNGETVASEMRKIASHIPIILITGFPDAVLRRELFDAVLAKPFRTAELLECFTRVLGKQSGAASLLG